MGARPRAGSPAADASRRPWSAAERWWVAIGTLAVLAVEAISLGVPSFWYDEAATYSGASRSWASLFDLLGEIDAVHGLFYALMHPLVHIIGPDAFGMRLPSAIAVALTAAAVYGLCREVDDPAAAAAASIVFVGLARTSWMATEARSFAMATLVATALSWILVRSLRAAPGSARQSQQEWHPRWIIAYAAVATLGVYLYVYIALIVAAHALTTLWVRPDRRRTVALFGAMAMAAAISIPLLVLVTSQRGQLGGTFPIDERTWSHVFISQFFHRQHAQAAVAWVLLAAAILVWIGRSRPTEPAPLRDRPVIALLVPWLVLPTLAILAVSLLSPTIYQPRALVICAPAFSVLVAVSLRRAFGSWPAIIGATLILALGVPAFLANRELTAKGSDWPVVAEYLAAHSRTGDGIMYSTPIDYHSWPSLMRIMQPEQIGPLIDVALIEPYENRAALFDARLDIEQAADRLPALDTVWYLQPTRLDDTHAETMTSSGFVLVSTWNGPRTRVEEWERG